MSRSQLRSGLSLSMKGSTRISISYQVSAMPVTSASDLSNRTDYVRGATKSVASTACQHDQVYSWSDWGTRCEAPLHHDCHRHYSWHDDHGGALYILRRLDQIENSLL